MKAFLKSVGMFSSGLAAFVPIAKCAVCAAAAGGVLTSLGIATIGIEPWFVPVVAVLLLIGLWGFWQSARNHNRWLWFALALAGSGFVIAGRVWELGYLLWAGTFVLLAAYVLDWRTRQFAIGELRLDLEQEAQPDESNEET